MLALNLDINYHRGIGCHLYTNDSNGNEIKILDLVGGFGSSFFGHNHPQLVSLAIANFNKSIPFSAQGSASVVVQGLSKKLNAILQKIFKQNYVITYGNSGTEAVEAALKHSNWRHAEFTDSLISGCNSSLQTFLNGKNKDQFELALKEFEEILDVKFNDIYLAVETILNYNSSIISKPTTQLAILNSYHGKTKGALEVTHHSGFKETSNLNDNCIYLKTNDLKELHKVVKENIETIYLPEIVKNKLQLKSIPFCKITHIILEPIQGEAGVIQLHPEYVQEIYKLSKIYNFAVIVDEIQCGMGRTGTFLFSEQLGIKPDYLLLSKSLGGGLSKISAMCCREDWFGETFDLKHSSTFAEDDFSCSMASQALDILFSVEKPMEKSAAKGAFLINELNKLKALFPTVIKEVRGTGLMIGIEFHSHLDSGSAALRLYSTQELLGYIISGYLLHFEKIRILPCLSNTFTLRIQPSYLISENECSHLIMAITHVCKLIDNENMAELSKFIVEGFPDTAADVATSFKNETFKINTEKTKLNIAFIGHFIEATDLKNWDKSFVKYSQDQCFNFLNKTDQLIQPIYSEKEIVTSTNGDTCSVHFIGLTSCSQMMLDKIKSKNVAGIRKQIDGAVTIAKELGATQVGLGGYCSIATNNGKSLKGSGICITTGNSLTVAAAVESLFLTAENQHINIIEATAGIVGSAGNIGSVCAELIAQKVNKIVLFGSSGNESKLDKIALKIFKNSLLNHVANPCPISNSLLKSSFFSTYPIKEINELSENKWQELFERLSIELGSSFPIEYTSDLTKLQNANLILCASNSANQIIFKEHIGAKPTVICDVAVPSDVSVEVNSLSNVTVIKGGQVAITGSPNFSLSNIQLVAGMAYACMSETILLGLETYDRHFSIGDITIEQVEQITAMANKHGFLLGNVKIEASF